MRLDKSALLKIVEISPLISIDLIIRNIHNEVLLGLRNNEPAKNYWFVPGGRICKGERLAQAFERISQEEIGETLTIQDARFLGVFEHFYQENFAQEPGIDTHYIVLAYEICLCNSLPRLPDDQHCQYRWILPDILLQVPGVHPYTKAYFS
jgi:colanic acid biosynthesis protein WcaH